MGEVVDTDGEMHQQRKQLQAPMQQRQHQSQPTLQQQKGELIDTNVRVARQPSAPIQHRAARQQQLQQQHAALEHQQQNPELQSVVPTLADPNVYGCFAKCAEFTPQNTTDSLISAARVAEQQVDQY